VFDAIQCITMIDCQRRLLPPDLQRFTTVQKNLYTWWTDGLLRAIGHLMVMAAQEMDQREAEPLGWHCR
jgi:hypothetical protein